MVVPFWPLKSGSLELEPPSRQRPKALCPYHADSLIQSGHISLVSNQTVFVLLLSSTRPSVSLMEVTPVEMWSSRRCQDPNGKAFHLDGGLAECRTVPVRVWNTGERGSFPAQDEIMFCQSIKKMHCPRPWLTWCLVMVILQMKLEGCNQRLSDYLVR